MIIPFDVWNIEGRQGGLGTTPLCQIKMKIKK